MIVWHLLYQTDKDCQPASYFQRHKDQMFADGPVLPSSSAPVQSFALLLVVRLSVQTSCIFADLLASVWTPFAQLSVTFFIVKYLLQYTICIKLHRKIRQLFSITPPQNRSATVTVTTEISYINPNFIAAGNRKSQIRRLFYSASICGII